MVSTDPAYPPQSSLNERRGEYEGFDIDVATEIAKRLGVDIAWETPAWDVITAGSWNGRWDMSVGSMTPTNDRQEVLDFTEPYYFTPAVVVVHDDNTTINDLTTDLDGKTDRRLQRLHLRAVPRRIARDRGLHFDFVIDDAEDHRLRHRHHGACRTSRSATAPARRRDHLGDDRAGLHRRRQPGEDRRRPGVLRAARRWPSTRARSLTRSEPGRGRRRDRRRDARRRHADRAVEEVVRRPRPHRPAVTVP